MCYLRVAFLLIMFAATAALAGGEPRTPTIAVAERYVALALERNLALHSRTLDVAEAQARLAEVRGALQPRIDLVARYSAAEGGRTIDLPLGDMLNGVYRTLNEYLASQGRTPVFPQLENQAIPLLRGREQETKLRLVQPLYRPEITRGIRAARAAAGSREAQLAAYRRELRMEVLTAYHRYLQTEMAVEILDSAALLTAEAVRTNRLLFEVDKVTEDRVLRAEADDLTVRQQRAEADRDRNLARAYFNFLLNRPLATDVSRPREEELQALASALTATDASPAGTPDRREELVAVTHAVEAARSTESAAEAGLRPSLALAIEGGVQGAEYRTGSGANFVQGSIVAEFNVWDGHQRRSAVERARLERRKTELLLESTREQLALECQQAGDDFRAALAAWKAASRRAEAAARVFTIVSQREREGMVAQLSFLEARNELTRAELNRALTRQQLFITAAVHDRAAALSPLP